MNGKWGVWGPYGTCNKKCGGGMQTKQRKCNNPKPKYGGKWCNGKLVDTKSRKCNTRRCRTCFDHLNLPLHWFYVNN